MIRSKLPDVGTTIFTVMSRLAIEHKAINLGQGFPDFDPDPALCALVTKAMADGHNQYPYMPGVAPLNRCIRVSVGPGDKLDLFEQALPKVLKSIG